MLELDEYCVTKIRTDASMVSLMGITATDYRVYSWYPAGDVYYTVGVSEAAIIYRNSCGSRPYKWSYPKQFPNITYYFRVMSIDKSKLGQASKRLIKLFDMTSIETTSWRVKWIELSGDSPGPMEGSPTMPIVSRNVMFKFSVVLQK